MVRLKDDPAAKVAALAIALPAASPAFALAPLPPAEAQARAPAVSARAPQPTAATELGVVPASSGCLGCIPGRKKAHTCARAARMFGGAAADAEPGDSVRECGTPGCTLPDHHGGMCESELRTSKRQRSPDSMAPSRRLQPILSPTTRQQSNKRSKMASAKTAATTTAAPRPTHVAAVERLLACMPIASGGRKFAVRWMGKGEAHDSWAREVDIAPSFVRAFDETELWKAPWSRGALYLVESCLQHRAIAGQPPQTLVRWLGYGHSWDRWVDDAALIPPSPRLAPLAVAPVPVPVPVAADGCAPSASTVPPPLPRSTTSAPPAPPSASTRAPPGVGAIGASCAAPLDFVNLMGMAAVRAQLEIARLEIYAELFAELGYDDLEYLDDLPEPELVRIFREQIRMKPGHAARFASHLKQRGAGTERVSPPQTSQR